jgi:argininosuccinate lyase
LPQLEQRFPHPDYARYVLGPGFRHSQELLWEHMLAANEAHVLMLHATGIVSSEHAVAILAANQQVAEAGAHSFEYSPEIEDLFFQVEARIIELAGVEAGGNLQIARSRNDLAATMCRLMVRKRLVEIEQLTIDLRKVLVGLIEQHLDTLMPGITHTQPAQPTTLAHYLLGVLGPLERDSLRLRQAWDRTNQSPLGAAAFTTTSFPIDRELTARLLGFDGFVVNGYDAVGAADHLLETTQALLTLTAGLSRFVGDLLIWARAEVGILRVGDEFIQISSIMPQKRNPVVLEHIRTRIGYVYGEAATVATMVHGAAFGDTNDVEDPIYPPVSRAFDATGAVLSLTSAVLATAEFDIELLANRAREGFMTATALADGLVRDFGLPFRTAHRITARAVQAATQSGTQGEIGAEVIEAISAEELESPLLIDPLWLSDQLDPWQFATSRTIPGGSAPDAVEREISLARSRLGSDMALLQAAQANVDEAERQRHRRMRELIGE